MAIGKSVKRDKLIGAKVVPNQRIVNGMGNALDIGTVCTVLDVVQGRGLTIESVKCPRCGQSTKITGVRREKVDFYEPEKHNKIHIPSDVTILLKDVSDFLNLWSGQEFCCHVMYDRQMQDINEWYEEVSKDHEVTEEEYQSYQRKLQAFELYKRIKATLDVSR